MADVLGVDGHLHVGPAPTQDSQTIAFEEALARFSKGLKLNDKEKKNFEKTSLEHLQDAITDIEGKLHRERNQNGLGRMKPFLLACEDLGRAAEKSCHCNNLAAFIWVNDDVGISSISTNIFRGQ